MGRLEKAYHAPVRVLLLTARPELWVNRRLEDAARAAGAEPVVVDALEAVAVCGPHPRLLRAGLDLLAPLPAAAIARVGNWRPESTLALLEAAVAAGVATPNPVEGIRVGRDHWRTLHALVAAGVPVPPAVAGSDPGSLASEAVAVLGLPVVVKQRRSRMGVGVIRCDRRDHLEAVLDSLWRVGDEVLVQGWVEAGGCSERLLVAGDEVVAAARFTAAAGEWRSNAARGGRCEPFDPSGIHIRLARAAVRATGLRHAAVDMLPHDDGPVVCEVNPTPGFRAVEEATGADVAARLVADALGCAEAAGRRRREAGGGRRRGTDSGAS